MTQGRNLIEQLKRKPHTYLEMNMLCISTSPHRRILEALRPTERLVKSKRHMGGKRYLTQWSVKVAK